MIKFSFFTPTLRAVFIALFAGILSIFTTGVSAAGVEFVRDAESASLGEWANDQSQMCCGEGGSYEYLKNDSANGGPSAARGGQYFLKLTRTRSQSGADVNGGNRVEVEASGFLMEKQLEERWLGMSMYVPGSFDTSVIGPWQSVIQWHDVYRSSPIHVFFEHSNEIEVRSRTYHEVLPSPWWEYAKETTHHKQKMPRDRWVDFVFHYRWDNDPNGSGFLEVWIDGNKVVDYNGPIGFEHNPGSSSAWFKMGSYAHEDFQFDRSFYFDEVRFGDSSASYESVAPGGENSVADVPRPNPPILTGPSGG